jgi:microcompartment protein CcmL/EutN
MTMLKAFEKKIRQVRVRCSVNLLLEEIGRVLTVAGAVAVLAVLTERLLALSVVNTWTLRGFYGLGTVFVLGLWLLRLPSRMQISLLLDERLRLQERFSTALALANSTDPFAQAARAEARETARHLDPRSHFPVMPGRSWGYGSATWLVVLALVLFMPHKDLLGLFRSRQQQQQQAEQIQTAKSDVEKQTSAVKSALRQLDNPELAKELAGLDQVLQKAEPTEIKRQAIRKLGELSEKIKQMQAGTQLEAMNLMQQMFRQLRGSPDALSQQLRLTLAQGNFAQASSLLKQMEQQLTQGKIPDQQRKDLARQLQQLAKQLQELAAKNEQLKEELEKLGLKKGLAKLGTKQLRQVLQKQGLSPEKVEQLLQKAAACRIASSRCTGLGQAMASCGAGGLSAGDVDALTGQLDELEAMQQQLMLTAATLAEIERASACLGSGMCQGLGCRGPFREGQGKGFGPGTGGPGRGFGQRGMDSSGQTGTKKTKVKSDGERGPVIATWLIKGTQIKGEAKREFSEVVQAGRDGAAEAVSENEIPRKYEQAIKSYFGRLEKSASQ